MKSKKITILLIILLMAGLTTGLFANSLDSKKAKEIAKNFYNVDREKSYIILLTDDTAYTFTFLIISIN